MKPGERAPEFDLSDQDGIRRTLASLLADGPLVL
ncbi:peroxiredoxin, partial [Rhodococcus hoagii]|nr:peroxiredoxin [Prescottella equi]